MMNRNLVAKMCLGLGLGLIVILYGITTSRSFESQMLALSLEQSDQASMLLSVGLGVSVILLITGKILYKKTPPPQ